MHARLCVINSVQKYCYIDPKSATPKEKPIRVIDPNKKWLASVSLYILLKLKRQAEWKITVVETDHVPFMQVTETMIVLLIELVVAQISNVPNTNLSARTESQMKAKVIANGYDLRQVWGE